MRSVKGDRTRPIVKNRLWMLTGNDRTLRSCARSLQSSASGHNLNVLMTIEIGRSAFEAGVTWCASHNADARVLHPVDLTGAFGRPDFSENREPTSLFRGGFYLSPMAGLSSFSWPFALI